MQFTDREFSDMKLDELNELEDEVDDEDERIFEAYRLCYMYINSNTLTVTVFVIVQLL